MTTSERAFPNSPLTTAENRAVVELPLTRGYAALVDPEDFERFKHLPWFALVAKSGLIYGAYKPSYSKKTFLLHRMILDAPDDLHVDHRDGDGLNCRRSNIRSCTRYQNMWNRRITRLPESGFRGVRACGAKWFGSVGANGERFRTPMFDSAFEASVARDALAREIHGEFAVLNHPSF